MLNEYIIMGILTTLVVIYIVSSAVISLYLFDDLLPFAFGGVVTCIVCIFLLGGLYIVGIIWGIILALTYLYALVKYIKEIL